MYRNALVWGLLTIFAVLVNACGSGSSGVGDGSAFAGGGDLLGVDAAQKLVEAGSDNLTKFLDLLADKKVPADYFLCFGKYLQTVKTKNWRACAALGAYNDPYERRIPGMKLLQDGAKIRETWKRGPKLILAVKERRLPGVEKLPDWPAACPDAVNLACVNPADSSEIYLLYDRIGTRKTQRSDVAGYLLHEVLHLMTGEPDDHVFTIALPGDPSKKFDFTAQTLFTLEGSLVQGFIEDFYTLYDFEIASRNAR